MYYDTYDLFVALSYAAAATKELKVGTGICLLIERDPITTAKEVASLDKLSGGRLLFGIGGGWNAEEMENHGTPFKERWHVLRERVLAMKEIWGKEKAEFHGKHVDFDPIFSNPKPAQKHVPVHIGGAAPWALRRCVEYCDGWMPIGMRDSVVEHIPELHRLAKEKGRDPKSIEVSVYYAPGDEDLLRNYKAAGVTRAIFGLPSEPPDVVLPMLDRYAELMRTIG
jgi:probable F420-dependent oxidoreductase